EAGGQGHVDRYLELAIFPEATDIPQSTLERYWGRTAGLDAPAVDQLCRELLALSLVQAYRLKPTPRLRLHDVFRDYLRPKVGDAALAKLHGDLLDAHREALPASDGGTSWWAMAAGEPYLWTQLVHHLGEAGEVGERDALVCDLRWVIA